MTAITTEPEVAYRGHIIKMHPNGKGWSFYVEHTSVLRLADYQPTYESALNQAKSELDILLRRDQDDK